MAKKIKICGGIGWDVTPSGIRRELATVSKGEDVTLEIASAGGSVFDGIEIYNQIADFGKNNPASKVNIEINGICASMGSVIACAPINGKRIAKSNVPFMIHNAWSFAIGDHRAMKKESEILNGLSEIMANSYVAVTKKGKKEIREMMNDETWLFGDEIKAAGFVDEIEKVDGEDENSRVTNISSGRAAFASAMKKVREIAETEEYQSRAAAFMSGLHAAGYTPPENTHQAAGENEKNTPTGGEMTEQEKAEFAKAEREAAITAERKRVAELTAMNAKYGAKCGAVGELINAAITDGREASAIAMNVLELAQAAAESPPNINTGEGNTPLGEIGSQEPEPQKQAYEAPRWGV